MSVILFYRRIPHHASHSGYDQLAKHVAARPYRPGRLYRLASRLPERFIQKVGLFNSEWYRRESLFTELELCARLLLPAGRLYHFLYGEDSLRLSSRWPVRWNNKIVATFHQPPEILETLFGKKPFIPPLSAAIALAGNQERFLQQFLPASRVFRVPHGVDTEFWCPPAEPERGDAPTFLTVGWWQRDMEVLRGTIARVHDRDPGVRFRIVTFESQAEHYRGLPNTELLFNISDEDLRREYRRARALLLPLKAVTANNAVLEAMACGTPVVSTDLGGIPEYVDQACAALHAPGEIDPVAETVLRISQDDAALAAMRTAARARSLAFSWARVGEQMDYVYRRILGRSCSSHYHQARPGPRNLCLLTEEYPPETGWGGIATYNYNLAQGLARAGHRVLVVAGCADRPSIVRNGSLEIHRVKFSPRSGPARWLQRLVLNPLKRRYPEFVRRVEFGLAAYKKIKHLQGGIPIHLIESPEYYGSAFFIQRLLRRCPVVVKLHTPTRVNCLANSVPVTRDFKLSDFLERGATLRADMVCAPSLKIIEFCRRWWLDRLPRVEHLEYPIDTVLFRPGAAGRPAPGDGPKVFLFTGRLEGRKGVQVLLPAFDKVAADLPGVELHLAGHDTPTFMVDGRAGYFHDYLPHLGLKAETLARVKFLGRRSREELIPLYQAAYACVIPSPHFENFPFTCLEAMACGKAVIVTDSGGMVEMAPHQVAGLHVRANDAESLADAIRFLAEHPAETAAMGENARRIIMDRYEMDRMTAKIAGAYERLIAEASFR